MSNGLKIHSIGTFLHCLLRTWHMVTAMADGMQNPQHLHLSTVNRDVSLNRTKRSGCKVDKMTHVK